MNNIFLARKSSYFFSGLRVMVIISMAMFAATPSYAANCEFNINQTTKHLAFTIPSDLRVPRDAPVGTVVWESSTRSLDNSLNSFSCTATSKWGLVNGVGAAASPTRKFDMPIGKTGLAWGIIYDSSSGLSDISLAKNALSPGSYRFDGTTFKLRIRKVDAVAAGARIPPGLLGYVSVNNEIDVFAISASNQASVGSLSCKTPDIMVKMGDQNRVGQFKGVGSSLMPVNFSIDLRECPEGINKISYLLKPNTQVVDATRSVVALDTESTAKGVGLQILDDGGNPVTMNRKIVFNGYDPVGGNFNIPLKAAYHQTTQVVEPGTANSSLTFVMSYD